MSKTKLEIISGVSRSTIENVEKGNPVSLEKLIKLADALDIRPADLFIDDAQRDKVTYLHILLMEKLQKSLTIK